MTPQTPERCGQRYVLPKLGGQPMHYLCNLPVGHRSEFHLDTATLATWSRPGDLELHATNNQADARCRQTGPVSLQHDACGALLKIELPTKTPLRSTLRCALGVEHRNMPHRAPDGTQWDTATPSATVDAPSEGDALSLGPIIERQRNVNAIDPPSSKRGREALSASQGDVMPLVREVMRLRRPKPAMPGDAVLRSAVRAEIVATVHYGHTPTLDDCTHHQCVGLRKAAAA